MRELSFHSCALWRMSVDDAIRTVADLGYCGIELNMETAPHFEPHVLPTLSAARRCAIAEELARCELRISSLSAHVDLCGLEPQRQQIGHAFVAGALELAADLGADIVHIYSGTSASPTDDARCWQVFVESLSVLLQTANQFGVRLAVEAVAFPRFLVWNLNTLLQLLDRIGRDDLYVNFDPSHFLIAGDSVSAAFEKLSDRIVHVHAKDARGHREDFEFPPVGEGKVDWRDLAKAMAKTRYEGFLSVEYEANIFGYTTDPVSAGAAARSYLLDACTEWLSAGTPPRQSSGA